MVVVETPSLDDWMGRMASDSTIGTTTVWPVLGREDWVVIDHLVAETIEKESQKMPALT